MDTLNRRNFIKTSVLGTVAVTLGGAPGSPAQPYKPTILPPPGVALTTGDSRADIAFRALLPYSKQIKQAIGNKLVILKPNNVSIDIPLCATHAETLEGVLEFLKSIRKLGNVIIAESAANGPSLEGFSNYGYLKLAERYPVKFVDLDEKGYEILYVFDEKDFRPHPVRFSKLLLSSDSFLVSTARMKTHDRTVVTLSLKNIIFGAPVKDPGFTFGKNRRQGSKSDKSIVHGGGYRGINYNLFSLSQRLHPHLAVIDGFEGMEGNGPNNGTPVDHRVCVASTDWFSADRVAVELMGVDFAKVGYLNYCAQAGMGSADLSKIEVIGESIENHKKVYRLNDNIERQLIWMKPVS